ncbi:low affinity immunoglobulin epsilon Fc receptor isoform X2 [Sapajus apella]|uniref:low affinity immunoglobulin epsilon Fc receptor isoform X2 n=1 Tax=Sapajus apella TaxID=9515 RepID=UPI00137AE65E|nr:low affinity immunoglobulin epsilon Fc receptor isoform X2 [Sapajus apella]
MNPPSQEIEELSRKKGCHKHWTQTVLLGLLTTALWAGLLTLLLLWHGDTTQNLKQLEERAALNVSQVSKYFERYQGDQMAQKSQATEISQSLEELRAEQQKMKSEDSQLYRNLNKLEEDLSSFKSQELNQRHAASDLLGRLQEEVRKLQMELQVSRATGSRYVAQACPELLGSSSPLASASPNPEITGFVCNACPENWVSFQQKCYYFGKGTKQWVHARYACEDVEGQLVSIHSHEEQDFLIKHASRTGSWIGLRNLDLKGEFIWMDGTPVDYSNWAPEEPTNRNQGEDCVMMRGSGDWNDIYCDRKLGAWVCDRLATCVPLDREGSAEFLEPDSELGPDSEPGQDGRLPIPSALLHP